jgi:DNA-binding CsgD family transcriptional regulator
MSGLGIDAWLWEQEVKENRLREKLRAAIERGSVAVPIAGCWLWEKALSNTGYGSIRIAEGLFNAHRAAYLAFRGAVPAGQWVLHRCDVRACVNPDHLFLGSRRDNIQDAKIKGRLTGPRQRPRGLKYKRPLSHLNAAIVTLAAEGASNAAIAKQLGIGPRTVARALRDGAQ